MMNKISRSKFVLIMSLIGMLSVIITIVSDFILLAKPTNAMTFFRMGTETMVDIEPWRITLGTFLGVVVLPFQTLGLTPLYYGLKPAGKVKQFIVILTTAHALLMGVAFHISYAFIASGWKIHYLLGNTYTDQIIDKFDYYWKILFIVMLFDVLIGSFVYVITIIKGKTLFPKWMCLLNPLAVILIVAPLIFFIPAPVGGIIAPAVLNITTLTFIVISTSIIYHKLRKLED